jgi:hypothetical protein
MKQADKVFQHFMLKQFATQDNNKDRFSPRGDKLDMKVQIEIKKDINVLQDLNLKVVSRAQRYERDHVAK